MLNGFQNLIFSGIDYKPFYTIHNFYLKKLLKSRLGSKYPKITLFLTLRMTGKKSEQKKWNKSSFWKGTVEFFIAEHKC